ncbi:hypothetical protein N7474_008687 [Penicillium riverlandense]|uniref:uncharacterized protein n=1 Tax=Penicillium riverlandense TaxID=1903569 RepID=UPI002546D146|nr:uncharacterized protein N7474_008687 [Penicillium riverlandense]KAJ5812386.1 hypothetical protein N7474_008687 [Penicillium riverlandense]
MALICLISTHDVPPATLSRILITAYKHSVQLDGYPTLLLLSSAKKESLTGSLHPTSPPIDPSVKSSFIGWSAEQIKQHLIDNADDDRINTHLFLVADERTVHDETLLLVEYSSDGEEARLDTVRIAAEEANAKAICVDVGVMSVRELSGDIDVDGAYRPRSTPQRGGSAPRKQL